MDAASALVAARASWRVVGIAGLLKGWRPCAMSTIAAALSARLGEARRKSGAPRAKVLAARRNWRGRSPPPKGLRVEAVDRGVLLRPDLARGVARALGLDRHVRHGVLADEAEHGGVGKRGAVGAEQREDCDSDGAFHGAFSFKKVAAGGCVDDSACDLAGRRFRHLQG